MYDTSRMVAPILVAPPAIQTLQQETYQTVLVTRTRKRQVGHPGACVVMQSSLSMWSACMRRLAMRTPRRCEYTHAMIGYVDVAYAIPLEGAALGSPHCH